MKTPHLPRLTNARVGSIVHPLTGWRHIDNAPRIADHGLSPERTAMSNLDAEKDHLALANRHVAEGEQRVANQRTLIAKLVAGGHDTTLASELLQAMLESLTIMRQDQKLILDKVGRGG
jgi:hypothetical protein